MSRLPKSARADVLARDGPPEPERPQARGRIRIVEACRKIGVFPSDTEDWAPNLAEGYGRKGASFGTAPAASSGRAFSEAISMRLRPFFLARYRARSTLRSRVSESRPCSGNTAIP